MTMMTTTVLIMAVVMMELMELMMMMMMMMMRAMTDGKGEGRRLFWACLAWCKKKKILLAK